MFGTVGRMMGSLLIFTIFLTLSVSGDSKLGDGTNKGQSMNFINKDFKNQYESQFTDDFKTVAVQIDKRSLHEVEEIAQQHGYKNLGQIGTLDGYYEFEHVHNRRTKRAALNRLQRDTRVQWSEPQRPLVRVKRQSTRQALEVPMIPWPDPLYEKQWYLHGGAQGGYDMKVVEAWKMGYSGKGVVTSILDDGIEPTHPDLAPNYDPQASKDINDHDDDPTPQDNGDNKHGTRCAGEVAAVAGNNQCGVGVAYHSKIGGVRMLDGTVTDSVEAASLSLNPQHIDIYSASWGPEDDGKTFDGPGPLAKEAFYKGITEGRSGKGNIFIWASGNGGSHSDSCSCDGYTTSIYTLSVSSATYNNRRPWYLEECPSTLTTTYSSAGMGEPAIVTVDMPHSCTLQHTGTSASAPMAAGIVALALEANPQLTWRDMQHLVVLSSDPTPLLQEDGWHTNAVGRQVSNKFGYGLMNAEALVRLARDWKQVPAQHFCSYDYKFDTQNNPYALKGKFRVNFSLPVTGCEKTGAINYLEHVQAVLTVQYSRRGDLKITIISPSGTESVLLPPRPQDINHSGFHKWPFLTVQQWGEDPRGVWTLIMENVGSEANFGTLHEWSLIVYGTETPPQPPVDWAKISKTPGPNAMRTEQAGNQPTASGNNYQQLHSWQPLIDLVNWLNNGWKSIG